MDAKQLFAQHTNGTGCVNYLYGPGSAVKRAEIMTAATGQRVVKSKARWGEFCRIVERLYGVAGGCIAERERQIALAACPDAWQQIETDHGPHWILKRRDGMPIYA